MVCQALGYICEDMSNDVDGLSEVPQKDTDIILTAIVDGIRADRGNPVRLAAATALYNSLEFCRKNMENEGERNMIMTVICEATQCADPLVKKKAFECIAGVANLYYDKLQPYMPALFQLTLTCIRDDSQSDAASQAIEFWNTLCDEVRTTPSPSLSQPSHHPQFVFLR
jgi:importin subunit beta-1